MNIEGFSKEKSDLLSELCHRVKCDLLCIQESHRDTGQIRPNISGMTLIAEIPHAKYGSAVFARPDIFIHSVSSTHEHNTEVITVDLGNCSVTAVYKPPRQPFQFAKPGNFKDHSNHIIVGDFNSHSINWGYGETDDNGKSVEEWADALNLQLIHDAKLPASFNSCRWKRGYNPDLIFASAQLSPQCVKSVSNAIPRSQHRPIMCQVQAVVKPINVTFKRRFNFNRANWCEYAAKIG